MAAATRGRHQAHDEEEHENEERWLVSYADMMTLLMCLFMVMFSISSVNISKFQDLQRSLQAAFSGKAVAGGRSIMQTGSTQDTQRAQATPPLPALTPEEALAADRAEAKGGAAASKAARSEQEDFLKLKRRVDEAASQLHLSRFVQTAIRDRGLVVRILTDGVFFDSGSAVLKRAAHPILERVAEVIAAENRHPVTVEGYTDSQPVRTSQYPSNWELSGARASSVVRAFVAGGVNPVRMTVAGFAQQHPIDSNATAAGRARNRRVEIVLTRLNTAKDVP
jgi:chemotaxis protein MotB